jgi:nucleotide-binding universal stress UspA family protein
MYKHILIATDGSELSQKALRQGIALARPFGAGVTALTVSPTFHNLALDPATAKHCDLIVMASHGRRGMSALLLGSETTKVLTHTKIPVLVCR